MTNGARRGDSFDDKMREAEQASTQYRPAPGRLMPRDIRSQIFRLAFRGYDQREVDEFLDRVEDELRALHQEIEELRRNQ